MAPQRVLKSLNKGPGKQRFVFKTFSQRVEDVDIDVFRSLAPVKFEPTSGSSFFHESLLRWRELNAAADFNAVYVEMMPIVQTMPQLLFHKEGIMKGLLSRLRLSAFLSLEPILSLIAILSRDLREEFLPYLVTFFDACSDLLKEGADQEPDLMEQIFVSISYVIKYLTTFLTNDIVFALRATKSLRYYHRAFVQDFVSESVSYLLRKAPPKQLIKGVRRLFVEVDSDPTDSTSSSCCTLLFHVLKGPASGLHSQAESVLHILLDKSILRGRQKNISGTSNMGSGENILLQVVSKTFLTLCEHMYREKLEILWACLIEHIYQELPSGANQLPLQDAADAIPQESFAAADTDNLFSRDKSVGACSTTDTSKKLNGSKVPDKFVMDADGPVPLDGPQVKDLQYIDSHNKNDQVHLVHLLSLLTDILEFRKGSRVSDYKPLFSLVPRLLQTNVLFTSQLEVDHTSSGLLAPAGMFQDWAAKLSAEILRFILALVKSHGRVAGASAGPGSIAIAAPTWAAVFNCTWVKCLFPFLKGLVEQETVLLRIFAPEIFRVLDLLVQDYSVEVLPIVLDLSQKRESLPVPDFNNIKSCIVSLIEECMKGLGSGNPQQTSSEIGDLIETPEIDPAMVWVALKCLPFSVGLGEESASLAWQCAVAIEKFVLSDAGQASNEERETTATWECVLATALSSHTEILTARSSRTLVQHADKYIEFAVAHRQSSHVLNAVGEFLDVLQMDSGLESTPTKFISLLGNLGPNLSEESKNLRVATLKILSHFEQSQTSDVVSHQPLSKRGKGNDGEAFKSDVSLPFESFRQLLQVESSALSHENVRQSIMLINAVKVAATATTVPDSHVVPLANALLGVLQNRFSLLWDPVMEALAGMLSVYGKGKVGQVLLSRLEATQNAFLHQGTDDTIDDVNEDFSTAPIDLWARFYAFSREKIEATQIGTSLILQLKILQKVGSFSEARSRQLIPLFLTFVGHSDSPQVGFETILGSGKSWKAVLKEWLTLIKEMKNSRSLFRGPVLKDILLGRFLSDSDPEIQHLTLEILLNWRDKYLVTHEEHLKSLISNKAVREELTTWDISKESHLIQDEDRSQVLNVVLMILYPKIMRRTVKSMGKSGVGAQRTAVLSFLARLESEELAPLFFQLMKPLGSVFTGKLYQMPNAGWISMVESGLGPDFIELVDISAIEVLTYKRKLGFLHMVMDSLDIFNILQMSPYLHALLAVVFRLLETCSSNSEEHSNDMELPSLSEPPGQLECGLEDEDDIRGSKVPIHNAPKKKGNGGREIRSLALKILATVMRKFEDFAFSPLYLDIFFAAIEQSVIRFVSENSFSSSPGSLMQCLISMSQRRDLALLLSRNPSLLPNVLSVFSVKGASPELLSAILKFVENILDLENQDEDTEHVESLRNILVPHMDVLLSSLGDCLSFQRDTATERRSLKRELKVLTRLSKFIKDTEVAGKLQAVLLPMLRVSKRMEPELFLEILHLLQGIGPILENESVNKCLPVLAPLLVSVNNQSVRLAVSETLVALAKVDQTLVKVAELINDLNSMSSGTIDELDYGRRLLAYDRLLGSQFPRLTVPQTVLVLSHVISDMGSEDMSLRHRASDCLQKYVQFAASLPEPVSDEVPLNEVERCAAELDDEALEPKNGMDLGVKDLKALVPSFLLPHIRNAMSSDQLVIRREWVLLLREMASNVSRSPALDEYHSLVNSDVEADFFHNIVHLQVHRRIKAMSVFKEICSTSHFSQGALSRIFVPLFMNSLFEAKGDREGNLVTMAVETIACISTQLRWEPYFSLLMRCFRLLTSKPDHQKVLVRVVCSILDSFHFFSPLSTVEDDKDVIAVCEENCGSRSTVEEGQVQGDFNLVADQTLARQLPIDVLSLLQKRVLPEIRHLMVSKLGIVSTPVALTQVKILKLMPEDVIQIELPQVVRTVVNALKSRSQAVRDEARTALVSLTETLGPNYLHFVIEVLRSSLMKGFELHVLGYTLNSILVKLVPKLKVGEIDYCLEQLLEVLENDIMGEVSEEKDVEAIAVKMKETKHMRSFESIKLLAQVVTFRTQAMALLGPVRQNLKRAMVPKVKSKLENMLQHIAMGLQLNSSVSQADLLVIVYSMVDDGVKEEKAMALAAAAKKQARIDKFSTVSIAIRENELPSKAPVPHFYLVTEFALQLLHSHLKRVKISPRDGDFLDMLNPLVGLLQECLNSKYDGVLASALKIFGLVLLLPLPAIDVHGSKITSLVFSICQRFSKADNSLLQACLNVLIILIRQCKSLRLSEDQLRTLLQFPIFTDLEGGSRMALSLLKAIVSRKLLVPELYDIMNRVANLMVTSYNAVVRQLCSQILLQFLLDYPLGKKRLQQHLDFFITNIGYTETSGREAALEMLHTVILKFPHPVIEEHTDGLFLPLVTRLVNDDSNQVRSMIGTILKVLMGKASPRSLQRMVDFAITWYKGANTRLWRTAAQVLGFLIEVMGKGFIRFSQDLYAQCIKILEVANSPLANEELESEEISPNALPWQDAYFSLTMMEKLLQQVPNIILLADLKTFWTLVASLLLHKHIWVRKVCGRLLSLYFASCGEFNRQQLESAALGTGDVFLLHPSWILLLLASFCKQLESGSIDDAMGEQLAKILEVLSTSLPLLPQSTQENFSFLGCSDLDSQERVAKALRLLGWKDTSQIGDTVLDEDVRISPVIEEKANGGLGHKSVAEGTRCSALWLVFKKLQKIALRVHPIQTKAVLCWYSAMAPRLGAHGIEPYLQSILIVLTKITEGSAGKVVPEDLKLYGDEVLNQLRELLGTSSFVNSYNAVREIGKEIRDKRKRAHKIAVLVDPEQNAKRKIKMNAKRQAQKKRKIIKAKVQMGL